MTFLFSPLFPAQRSEFFLRNPAAPSASKPEHPVVLVKWNDYAKWVLERVESFPKNQRFVLGRRLSNQVMEVLEGLVEASYSWEKHGLLAAANRKMEVVRWTVRMCKDRNLLSASQFEHSAKSRKGGGKGSVPYFLTFLAQWAGENLPEAVFWVMLRGGFKESARFPVTKLNNTLPPSPTRPGLLAWTAFYLISRKVRASEFRQ